MTKPNGTEIEVTEEEINHLFIEVYDDSATNTLSKLVDNYKASRTEWVSVDDRLPEDYKHVLVAVDGNIIGLDYYGEWWKEVGITDWQPLPSPPSKGDE